MKLEARHLVDRLWNYCNVLRDDGVSSLEYLEQLSFLVFLKMAAEIEEADKILPEDRRRRVLPDPETLPDTDKPRAHGWPDLLDLTGHALEEAYTQLLTDLGKQDQGQDTTLGLIFHRARNRLQNPANLRRLIVDLIDKEEWLSASKDIKGDAYEALIARSAEDTKAGAGQYFTPRVLIESIVRCMRPSPEDTITDPACGTGGFLLAAYDHIVREYGADMSTEDFARYHEGKVIWGTELVPQTARLAAMNLLLHNIGRPDGKPLIHVEDALAKVPTADKRASLVLANPPFGKKSSIVVTNDDGSVSREDMSYHRKDFWETTTNKQFNFLQHIANLLTDNGRAAVVLPDNVLFEGGRGASIRRELLKRYNLHTMLRLPKGIFYAGGVKANVLFFDAAPPRRSDDEPPHTQQLWVYDLRTGNRFTLKQNPLLPGHLEEFEKHVFGVGECDLDTAIARRVPGGRLQVFDGNELVATKDVNLHIGLIEPDEEDPAESKSLADLTLALSADLREALAELEDLAVELDVELPPLNRG
ncbi:N-6 DNA methylase [Streptomyces sp. SID8381]|uniref:class I SAM-dependent DNA methyltransferase n=1 Tax=unclassified Streptomyces TaxID=2593676 RepID=UPI00037FA939|nr:class I SAM-dependent DNA methyltransferase [Streptomyces sp. Amel2xE9]MYX31481.1 N-6 DNA methylase [Streptomyces sp. SID8381]